MSDQENEEKGSGCDWHAHDLPIDGGLHLACDRCGTLLSVADCPKCGQTFLNWKQKSFDDVIAGPASTSQGDLCCVRCLPEIEREIAEAEDADCDYPNEDY